MGEELPTHNVPAWSIALEINLEAVVQTPESQVDMKSGLDTFQGVSDAMRKIAESLLNDEVIHRINYKSDIRTTLKESFEGSFGQRFSLDVLGSSQQRKLNEIGLRNFIDLIHYFMTEAKYGTPRRLTPGAAHYLDSVRFSEADLVEEIRRSCMRRVHKVAKTFSHNLVVRAYDAQDRAVLIGKFDKKSADLLDPTFDPRIVQISASVTRLNINTGNGRIQLLGENTTTAFGFAGDYNFIDLRLKKAISENLDDNNGVRVEQRTYIELMARRLVLRDGKIVKYVVAAAQ